MWWQNRLTILKPLWKYEQTTELKYKKNIKYNSVIYHKYSLTPDINLCTMSLLIGRHMVCRWDRGVIAIRHSPRQAWHRVCDALGPRRGTTDTKWKQKRTTIEIIYKPVVHFLALRSQCWKRRRCNITAVQHLGLRIPGEVGHETYSLLKVRFLNCSQNTNGKEGLDEVDLKLILCWNTDLQKMKWKIKIFIFLPFFYNNSRGHF